MTAPSSPVLSAARLALAIRRMREEKPDVSLLASEPIAIVGMGCRFPGGGDSPENYWRMLQEGVDAVTPIPAERWNDETYFDREAQAPGKMNSRWGSFLPHAELFDPLFFGIAPREAAHMDGQQRLLLEVAWEALWDSGRSVDSLSRTATGVYVAIYNSDYARLLFQNPLAIGPNTLAGASHSIASGRISYLLDLRGPSISVDTACSSSLVTIHLACQALRMRECNLALAGAATLHLSPEHYIALSKLGMLAPDGKCRTFDASASGFVPGEGSGVVVLKLLADALKDGDRIYAVIRGSAVNEDGRTNVMTAPNGLAQQDVVRAALRNAQVKPTNISYVETHGTGTPLGDPIEVEALAATIGSASADASRCALGAVKSNLGHLEAAAGVAGLIKAALALHHEEIPPNLHFSSLNPNIHLEETRFFLPDQPTPWKRGKEARFAGTSAFGFGGTNAHIVLEEAPLLPQQKTIESDATGPFLLPVSARTPTALRDFAQRYREFLRDEKTENISFHDLCHSAATRRDHYEERLALLATTKEETAKLLDDFLGERTRSNIAVGRGSSENEGIAFICSGQGSQWAHMGVLLFERQPVFRVAIEECDALIRAQTGWSLLEILSAPEDSSKLPHTEYAQPAIFAIEVALAELWKSWGVLPSTVIGHSAGEVAAAHIAGVLDLPEAVRVVVNRGRLMEPSTGHGKMAAVHLAAQDVAADIAEYDEKVSIAAINSPVSTVISGDPESVEQLLEQWKQRGVGCRKMPVDYAFHSAQMQPFSEELTRTLGTVATRDSTVPIISTVRGAITDGEQFNAVYWGQNIRRPVLFAAGVHAASELGLRTFVEIGPHPVLLTYIEESLGDNMRGVNLVPSLRRNQDETHAMLTSLGKLYALGCPIAWSGIYAKQVSPVSLPVYPYQRERFWIDTKIKTAPPSFSSLSLFSGTPIQSPAIRGRAYQLELSTGAFPYLADHRIQDRVLIPMTAFLEIAGAAIVETLGEQRALLNITAVQPLTLPEEGSRTVQVVIEDDQFRIFSLNGNEWELHVSGHIGGVSPRLEAGAKKAVLSRTTINVEEFYTQLRENGAQFGPSFRGVESIAAGPSEAIGRVKLNKSERTDATRYRIHPALLDACVQIAHAAAPANTSGTHLPFGIDRCEILRTGEKEGWAHITTSRASADGFSVDIQMTNDSGDLVARIEGLHLKRRAQKITDRRIFEVQWQRAARASEKAARTGHWLIVADNVEAAEGIALAIQKKSCRTSIVNAADSVMIPSDVSGVVRLIAEMPGTENLEDAQARGCGSALSLTQQLIQAKTAQPPRLCIVTQNAAAVQSKDTVEDFAQSSVWGLARTIAMEHPELRCLRIDTDSSFKEWTELAEEFLSNDSEEEVAYRKADRYVPRLAQKFFSEGKPQILAISAGGSIDNLISAPLERRAPADGEVEVEVETSALNFRDVLNVLGMYPGEAGPLGLEFCGKITRIGKGVSKYQKGDRVMGIAWGSFASYITTSAKLIASVPAELNFAEAVTVPNAFLTAYHCLQEIAALKRGQRVLIHAATGGVGLAAVQIAMQSGAEIFATAGSEEKRNYLRSLGIKHVFHSRTLAFAKEIQSVTGGKGVDIVLNSLAGDFIDASFSALARGGCFIEIGKTDIWSHERVSGLQKSIRYFIVDLAPVIDNNPDLIQSHLSIICKNFASKILRPLPFSLFDFDDAANAFRYMAQAKHIGKVVLRHETPVRIAANATYLITGGLGAIGLSIAEWMVKQGARHLVLMGRSAPSAEAKISIDAMRAIGARMEIRAVDVSQRMPLAKIFSELRDTMPPLRGIVHSAGVLDDGIVAQQTWERFEKVLEPKMAGAWNLHELSRDLPLDFFILFSSWASLTGSPSQGSYAAGNSFLDALAHHRKAKGLPALSINWGAWAEVGMAARVKDSGKQRVLPGLRPMAVEDCLACLAIAIAHNAPQLAIADVDWTQWKNPPRLLADLVTKPTAAKQDAKALDNILQRIENTPSGSRRKVFVDYLREVAQQVLALSEAHFIDERQPLLRMGLDSLMAVEFRNHLAAALQRSFTATLLFDYPTIAALADYLAGTNAGPEPKTTDSLLGTLDELSDEQAEELLKEELGRNL